MMWRRQNSCKIILFLLLIICQKVSLAETNPEAIERFAKDTLSVQPVTCNAESYEYFKGKKIYDYSYSQIETLPFWQRVREKIRRFLAEHFFSNITDSQINVFLWVVTIIVLVIIVLLLFFFKPSFFFRNKKNRISFSVDDENIHELNFAELIQKSLKTEQYADAIRWEYLRLLKILDSREIILWEPHKTVIEYANAVKNPKIKDEFKDVSLQFLYYRYGNFEASQNDWNEFMLLTNTIIKQI